MSESALWSGLTSWIYGGSSLVTLACDIAILITITTVVRRHRPDAYRALQVWAIGSVATFVFMMLARFVVPTVAMRTSTDSFYKANALLTILGTGLHVGLVALFLRGVVALAQPPKPMTVEGAPPYR